jgi:two-component system response regulator AdeR
MMKTYSMLEPTKQDVTTPLHLSPLGLYGMASTCNILIIDREVDSARSLSAVLNKYGYKTSHISSPKQALSQLFSAQLSKGAIALPDLIICDLLGDEMDGLEFLRDVRKPGYPHLPVIIVTSLESNSTFEKAVIDMGADDFVIKPVRPTELLLRVRLLLRGLPGVAAWRAPELL